MILTCLTPKDQITIPRAIMKKLDINAGSEVFIEVNSGAVIIRKIDVPPEMEKDQLTNKLVNY